MSKERYFLLYGTKDNAAINRLWQVHEGNSESAEKEAKRLLNQDRSVDGDYVHIINTSTSQTIHLDYKKTFSTTK